MIKVFKDYYDKHGSRYKVVSFNGDKYACESYRDGKCIYLKAEELLSSPPVKSSKVKFTDIIKEDKQVPEELTGIISEPVYEEPIYEKNTKEDEPAKVEFKDNSEETAGDFYADF